VGGAEHSERAARIEALASRMRQASGTLHPEGWLDLDLTITQLKALLVVQARQPLTLTALASAIGVAQTSASALVERLVRLGMLSRRDDPENRRQIRLELASEGEAVLHRIEERSAQRTREALALMSPEGLAALETALADLTAALERRRDQLARRAGG